MGIRRILFGLLLLPLISQFLHSPSHAKCAKLNSVREALITV